jgi:hypothetical protein
MKLFVLIPLALLGLFLCLVTCIFDLLGCEWIAGRMERLEAALGEFFYRITI